LPRPAIFKKRHRAAALHDLAEGLARNPSRQRRGVRQPYAAIANPLHPNPKSVAHGKSPSSDRMSVSPKIQLQEASSESSIRYDLKCSEIRVLGLKFQQKRALNP